MTAPRQLGAVLVGMLCLTGFALAPSSAQASHPHLGAVRDLVAITKGDRAIITWRRPASGVVARYVVEAHRAENDSLVAPDFGSRIVGASARRIVWPDLPLNHPLHFTVVPIGPDRPGSVSGASGPYNSTGVVRATNSHCVRGSHGYCVVVNNGDELGPERRPGAGLLLSTVRRSNRWVRPLKLRFWRIGSSDPAGYRQAAAFVHRRNIIQLLSDAWDARTGQLIGGVRYAADPWSDWRRYRRFVTHVVEKAVRQGRHPMWEIENEPENYPYSLVDPPTRALVQQQYLVAYRAIKKADRKARIVGPSIDWQYENPAAPWYLDMKTFIPFAAQHRMRLYAISWHRNYSLHDHAPLLYDEMPAAVRDDAEVVRELIRENPGIGHPKLFADENSSGAGQFIPGFGAGYLAAEDQAGIDEANRACWSYPPHIGGGACFAPTLGQLLNRDGRPNASYWVMRAYATLHGSRVASEVSDISLSALAATDPHGTTRVLLGRHQTCSQPTTGPAYCQGPAHLARSVPTTVHLLVPKGARSAAVSVQLIANSRSDMVHAPKTSHSTVRVRDGHISISLPTFGDGAAYFLTIKPSTRSGATADSGDRTRAEVPAPKGAAAPARLLAESGSGQTGSLFGGFRQPLVALLTDQYGNPLAGKQVVFNLGSTSHGAFPGNAATATVTTDSEGLAVSPPISANLQTGQWVATVYAAGVTPPEDAPTAYFGLTTTLF